MNPTLACELTAKIEEMREANLERFSDYEVDTEHPYYLVHAPLNKALAAAADLRSHFR